jgi:hypothetical protein
MPRSYRHIKQYKNKMLKKSYKVYPYGNGQNIVLIYEQTHCLYKRYNRKQMEYNRK